DKPKARSRRARRRLRHRVLHVFPPVPEIGWAGQQSTESGLRCSCVSWNGPNTILQHANSPLHRVAPRAAQVGITLRMHRTITPEAGRRSGRQLDHDPEAGFVALELEPPAVQPRDGGYETQAQAASFPPRARPEAHEWP